MIFIVTEDLIGFVARHTFGECICDRSINIGRFEPYRRENFAMLFDLIERIGPQVHLMSEDYLSLDGSTMPVSGQSISNISLTTDEYSHDQ
jgi:hypothetical protein